MKPAGAADGEGAATVDDLAAAVVDAVDPDDPDPHAVTPTSSAPVSRAMVVRPNGLLKENFMLVTGVLVTSAAFGEASVPTGWMRPVGTARGVRSGGRGEHAASDAVRPDHVSQGNQPPRKSTAARINAEGIR